MTALQIWIGECHWGSVKTHLTSANIAQLKKFIGARLTEIHWLFIKSQTHLLKFRACPKNILQYQARAHIIMYNWNARINKRRQLTLTTPKRFHKPWWSSGRGVSGGGGLVQGNERSLTQWPSQRRRDTSPVISPCSESLEPMITQSHWSGDKNSRNPHHRHLHEQNIDGPLHKKWPNYMVNSSLSCIERGSCHKRQKPQAPTPQATIRNRQTRKVANAKGLNRNTNLA